MAEENVLLAVDDAGRATVTLNRPEVHNAFDDALIAQLTEVVQSIAAREDLRVMVLAAAGKSFSAGADLNWMRRVADYSEAENPADAEALTRLLTALDELPIPTVARVQGAALGGGVGLVACCDIAVAAAEAKFALSEVRLGLIPAVISPYVLAAIGSRTARRYFLTAERFDAEEARRIGLVHAVVAAEELDAAVDGFVDAVRLGGPAAVAACKRLVLDISGRVDAATRRETAERIARIRATGEGREGVAAFLEKRKPDWQS